MANLPEFMEWLAAGITDRAVVECMEILHSSFGRTQLARWHEKITVTHEDGTVRNYQAADWLMEPATVGDTLQQGARAAISSLDGRIYDKLFEMTRDQRADPMTITHRLYFNDDLTTVLVNPPPKWQVLAVQAEFDKVVAELSAMPLKARAIGNYYTLANFPILRYV